MKTIGLKRLTVKLLPHNKEWENIFKIEEKKLRKLFCQVEHVGSTAIKGIKAKPIIDIIAAVPAVAKAKEQAKALKRLGYELRPLSSNRRQMLFVKGKEDQRTHYLHLIRAEGKLWRDYIFFRDYLSKNKNAARSYEKLKMELAEKFAANRPKYTKAKNKFIKKILKNNK